jgi:hypothetical protein
MQVVGRSEGAGAGSNVDLAVWDGFTGLLGIGLFGLNFMSGRIFDGTDVD